MNCVMCLDSDFKNFVEDLDKPPEMLPSAQKQREQAEALKKEGQEQRDTAPGPIVTPLMEFIINKRLSKSSKRNQKSKITVLQKDDDKVRKCGCVFLTDVLFCVLNLSIDEYSQQFGKHECLEEVCDRLFLVFIFGREA